MVKEYQEQLKILYQNPKLYDEEYATLNRDVNFWIDYIEANKIESVLELGCGSGRIGFHLIPRIKKYVGIDLSEAFLQDFELKLLNLGNKTKVRLIKGDMTNFCLDDKFDLIILPFNGICHLYSLAQVISMLSCVKRHMTKSSRFVIDCFNPDIAFLQSNKQRVLRNEFIIKETGERICVYETNEYLADTQVNYIRRYYVNESSGAETELHLPMKMYYPVELDALLQLNGFLIQEKWGNYKGESFVSNSLKQIVCTKYPG